MKAISACSLPSPLLIGIVPAVALKRSVRPGKLDRLVGGDVGGQALCVARLLLVRGVALRRRAGRARLRQRGIERRERDAAGQQRDEQPAREERWLCDHAR